MLLAALMFDWQEGHADFQPEVAGTIFLNICLQ